MKVIFLGTGASVVFLTLMLLRFQVAQEGKLLFLIHLPGLFSYH